MVRVCCEPPLLATRFCGVEWHAQLSQLYASAPPTMPPALTRAASTGVDAYALFRAIDIDDSSAVPVEELLLCGAALGAQ